MTNQEIIDVVKAASEGKPIEYRVKPGNIMIATSKAQNPWVPHPSPCWNFEECEYRVRREPRTIYLNEYPGIENSDVYDTRENASRGARKGRLRLTKWVEVLE